MNFKQRSTQDELMDTEIVSYEKFHECLQELETINHWTFAYPPTLRWIGKILKNSKKKDFSILDVGSGGADMLRRIWERFGKVYEGMVLTGVDLNPWSKIAAESLTKELPIQNETCDIFNFDPDRKVDVVISSLFTHHLNDEQLVKFLQWMDKHSTIGWFVNDLHRHPVPYYFIKFATRLLSKNHLIKHDAAVSVSRAFTRADWQKLLREANLKAQIRWHFPFRYCVGALK